MKVLWPLLLSVCSFPAASADLKARMVSTPSFAAIERGCGRFAPLGSPRTKLVKRHGGSVALCWVQTGAGIPLVLAYIFKGGVWHLSLDRARVPHPSDATVAVAAAPLSVEIRNSHGAVLESLLLARR